MRQFYVQRFVSGIEQDILVNDWYYQAWVGCFCLISDRDKWNVHHIK